MTDIHAIHKRFVVAGFARMFAFQASSFDTPDDQLQRTMGHLLDALQDYSRHVRGISPPAPKAIPARRKPSRWQLFRAFILGRPSSKSPRKSNGRFAHGA